MCRRSPDRHTGKRAVLIGRLAVMTYQSLYRRYRPATFAQVRGQEHLVTALRNAVIENRLGHAYLFSGPRGTGKTSTARILAKALNCENVVDGEPCCQCDSCLAIEQGTSFDVHELDAASNNGVEAIRDLIAKASMGTPGRTKVYILDEVHMLSTAASNALLKTLEEPPPHVVFVLATTDPQNVLPTIRSRTQHFEVRLLSSEDLSSLVDYVVSDAGLDVDEQAKEYVIAAGGGSARDTLSALDRVVAAGGIPDSENVSDELVEAICERDTARALLCVERAVGRGQHPRAIGEALLARLRDVFLLAMGADMNRLSANDRNRIEDQIRRMGPAAITKAVDVLGEAFVGTRNALDPRLPLEVALVRLTRDDTDSSLAGLAERVARLEQGGVVARPAATTSAAPTTSANAGMPSAGRRPADAAREQLRRKSGDAPARPARPERPGRTSTKPSSVPPTPETASSAPSEPAVAAAEISKGTMPEFIDLERAWKERILEALPQRAKARYQAGHWVKIENGTAIFGLPNKPHAERCEELRPDVERVLAAQFGVAIPIALIVDESSPDPSAPPMANRRAKKEEPQFIEEEVDISELTDATGVKSANIDRIAAVFPGAELLAEPEGEQS